MEDSSAPSVSPSPSVSSYMVIQDHGLILLSIVIAVPGLLLILSPGLLLLTSKDPVEKHFFMLKKDVSCSSGGWKRREGGSGVGVAPTCGEIGFA